MNDDKKKKIELVLDGEISELKKKKPKFDGGGGGGNTKLIAASIELVNNGWVLRIAVPDHEIEEIVEETTIFKEEERDKLLEFLNKNL